MLRWQPWTLHGDVRDAKRSSLLRFEIQSVFFACGVIETGTSLGAKNYTGLVGFAVANETEILGHEEGFPSIPARFMLALALRIPEMSVVLICRVPCRH